VDLPVTESFGWQAQPPLFRDHAEVVRSSLALNFEPSEGGPPRHRELRLGKPREGCRAIAPQCDAKAGLLLSANVLRLAELLVAEHRDWIQIRRAARWKVARRERRDRQTDDDRRERSQIHAADTEEQTLQRAR
jgi:hypothetical protein